MDTTKKQFKTPEEYINSFPEKVRTLLQTIRQTIKEEVPEAEEVISYQMPTFKLNGKILVHFAAWKDHIAIYPATSSMETTEELEKYRTGKGTFQFPIDKPLPLKLFRKIVKIRIKELH